MTPEIIKEKIMQNIPDANVVVEDLAGDQKHFGVDVISSKFKGKSIIEQHQMIFFYKALGYALKGKNPRFENKNNLLTLITNFE